MDPVSLYIQAFPPDVRARLQAVREVIKAAAPQASERICMKMPTYDLNGKWLVHFAGYKNHIGFYPQPGGIEEFAERLQEYKTSKGAVQFSHNKPLPLELIGEIVRYRVKNQQG